MPLVSGNIYGLITKELTPDTNLQLVFTPSVLGHDTVVASLVGEIYTAQLETTYPAKHDPSSDWYYTVTITSDQRFHDPFRVRIADNTHTLSVSRRTGSYPKDLDNIELEWAPRASQPSGDFWQATGQRNSFSSAVQNRLIITPIEVFPGFNYTKIGVYVGLGGNSGASLRIGLYSRLPNGGLSTFILDSGNISAETIGNKQAVIDWTPTQPLAYAALVAQNDIGAMTFGASNSNSNTGPGGLYSFSTGETKGHMYVDSVSGAIPTNPSPILYESTPTPIIYYS